MDRATRCRTAYDELSVHISLMEREHTRLWRSKEQITDEAVLTIINGELARLRQQISEIWELMGDLAEEMLNYY